MADPEDIDPQGRESEIEQIEKLVVRLKANKVLLMLKDEKYSRGSGWYDCIDRRPWERENRRCEHDFPQNRYHGSTSSPIFTRLSGLEKGFTVLKKPDSKTPKNIFDQSGPWFSAWNSIFNALLKVEIALVGTATDSSSACQ